MSDRRELLDAADASKLHAEINQLHNQEFLITAFALALFAGSISVIVRESGLSIALLIVLAGDYRAFVDSVTFPSQRTVSTIVFGVLGLLGTATPSVRFLGAASPISRWGFS